MVCLGVSPSKISFMSKLFSKNIEYDNSRALITYKILGLEFIHRISKPLLNKKFCSGLGIKTMLISRFDGIGDFLLTRPFIKYIKESQKFKDYKIILAGKPEFVEIAKRYDDKYIDDYITCNFRNTKAYKNLINSASKMYFSIVVNPVDSKVNTKWEKFVKEVKADAKICHLGFFGHRDMIRYNEVVKKVLNNYTRIIDTGKAPIFVRDKNKIFFEELIEEKIGELLPLCELKNCEIDINSDYVIISPFSRSKIRTYSKTNYAKIIEYITQNLNLPVMIFGNKAEEKSANELVSICKNKKMIYNMAGKLPITETILYIKRAKLLIANETGTVHIAQNYGVNTVCISNGSYLNTFQPYPAEESYITYIYPDNFVEFQINENTLGDLSRMDINEIPYEKVIEKINYALNATPKIN